MWFFKKKERPKIEDATVGAGFSFITPAIQKYIEETGGAGKQKTYSLYNNGKPDFEAEMQVYLDAGLKQVVIVANQCCSECKVFDGMVVTIQKAREEKLLPIRGCTNRIDSRKPEIRCTCCYVPDFG